MNISSFLLVKSHYKHKTFRVNVDQLASKVMKIKKKIELVDDETNRHVHSNCPFSVWHGK